MSKHLDSDFPIVEVNDKVSILYKGYLEDESVFDESDPEKPLTFIVGSNEIIPGLEQALMGLALYEKKATIEIPVDLAYGPILDDMIAEFPIDILGDNRDAFQIGSDIVLKSDHGQPIPAMIKNINDKTILVDANHHLAGKVLFFDIEIVGIEKSDS